jgi:type II secretory pathway pseudopilin PulG
VPKNKNGFSSAVPAEERGNSFLFIDAARAVNSRLQLEGRIAILPSKNSPSRKDGNSRCCSAGIAGFSLLELLLAIIVLTIGLLALFRAQLFSLQYNRQSFFKSAASIEMNAIAESLYTCKTLSNSQPCINSEIRKWRATNTAFLPDRKTEFSPQGNDYAFKLKWKPVSLNSLRKSSPHLVSTLWIGQ